MPRILVDKLPIACRPATRTDPPCPCGLPAVLVFTSEFGEVVWCDALGRVGSS